MPEIGECYSIAKSIPKKLGQIKKIKTSANLKKHVLKGKNKIELLENAELEKIVPYGKSIWFFGHTSNHKFIVTSQLGMTGSWFVGTAGDKRGHIHLEIELEDFTLKYSDPRMFGKMNVYLGQDFSIMSEEIIKKHKWGIDPIQKKEKQILTQLQKLLKSNQEIKAKLLEQNLIFGIGNYLASEILFDAKIDPFRKSSSLLSSELVTLAKSIKKWVTKAEKSNGFSFAGGYILPDGSFGNLASKIKVYQKEDMPCPRDGAKIRKEFIKGRATFFCNKCQK